MEKILVQNYLYLKNYCNINIKYIYLQITTVYQYDSKFMYVCMYLIHKTLSRFFLQSNAF